MKPTILSLSLAAGLAIGAAAPALAQQQGTVDPAAQAQYEQQLQQYQDQQQQYQDQQQRYQDQRSRYQDSRAAYDARREAWRDQRDRWAANRDQYLAERDHYDRLHGRGAWDRVYVYDDGYIVRRHYY